MGFVLIVGYIFSFILGFSMFVAMITLLTGGGHYTMRHKQEFSQNTPIIIQPVITYEMYEKMVKEDITKIANVNPEFMSRILEYVSSLSDSCIYATYVPECFREEFVLMQLKKNSDLANVPVSLRTTNVCRESLLIDYAKNYKYVINKTIITRGIALNAFYNVGISLKIIPEELINEKVAKDAFIRDIKNISYIPKQFVTDEMIKIFFEEHKGDWYKYNIPAKYQNEDDIQTFIACKMSEDDYKYIENIKIKTPKLVKLVNKNPLLIHKLDTCIVKDIWFDIEEDTRNIIIKKYAKSDSILLINELFTMSGVEFNEKYSDKISIVYHKFTVDLPNGCANNIIFTCENLVEMVGTKQMYTKNIYTPPQIVRLSDENPTYNNTCTDGYIRDVFIPSDAIVKFYLPNTFVTDKAILGAKRFLVNESCSIMTFEPNSGKQYKYFGRNIHM